MSDLPLSLPPGPAATLAAAMDREGKIDRALEALGPLAGRDVVVVGGGPVELARRRAGSRVTSVTGMTGPGSVEDLPDESADAIVSTWAAFRGVDARDVAVADRVLRPAGRLLVVHDYGRDDVSRLRGDLPEYGTWSRREGPFLANGFRVRVIHCFWTFDTLDEATAFLGEAFGADGTALAAGLKRPRLSWNVAVYHRTRGGAPTDEPAETGADADADVTVGEASDPAPDRALA
jgi:hypothetical protein